MLFKFTQILKRDLTRIEFLLDDMGKGKKETKKKIIIHWIIFEEYTLEVKEIGYPVGYSLGDAGD